MNLIHHLNRPEYIFRPRQICNRLLSPLQKKTNESKDVVLPWGAEFRVNANPSDTVSYSIWLKGIYDVSLTEIIWRLLVPGEIALDVGANIGYVTSLMASRVGTKGKVLCFEPNPEMYQSLCKKINVWQQTKKWGSIVTSSFALSNQSGRGILKFSPKSPGEAFLVSGSNIGSLDASEGARLSSLQTYSVQQSRLDEYVNVSQIHLLKIDVEGHELEVLEGAGEWITKRKIRDVVFEEHKSFPNKTTEFLESCGYTVFRVRKGFWKPLLGSPTQTWNHPWEPPNYLATVEPQRALQLLSSCGWRSFRSV